VEDELSLADEDAEGADDELDAEQVLPPAGEGGSEAEGSFVAAAASTEAVGSVATRSFFFFSAPWASLTILVCSSSCWPESEML
jgi:hypothetical protein